MDEHRSIKDENYDGRERECCVIEVENSSDSI